MNKVNLHSQNGYTMLELLLAVFVGSIVLAGAYASYAVVAAQYQRNSGLAEIRDMALPTIKIIARDLRMTGHREVDDNIESVYPKIDPPIIVTDVAGACCDSVSIIYDKALNNRVRVIYAVAARSNPARNALFMTIDKWNGVSWANQVNNALVADYVEDFQLETSLPNTNGYPTLIGLNIVFKSRNKTPAVNSFTKSNYASGNNDNYTISDNYLREEFDYTVKLRNISN